VRTFATASLLDLLHSIVAEESAAALAELHHRTLFRLSEKGNVRFTTYAEYLCRYDNFDTETYNSLVAKFSQFPSEYSKVDCRKYYQPVLKQATKYKPQHPLKHDQHIATLLQSQVLRHYKYAKQEAQRSCGDTIRYAWNVNNQTIYLQFPRSITRRERSVWLNTNYSNHNSITALDKPDIQAHIDRDFIDAKTVSLTQVMENITPDVHIKEPWEVAEAFPCEEIAQAVAEEKSERIDEQRPAIRKLGENQLHGLILTLFSRVLDDDHITDEEVAQRYGLSKSTLSRFAGTHHKGETIPDLWKNTLEVISHTPQFSEFFSHNLVVK